MKALPLKKFVCPMDGLPLVEEGGCARCESGHSFDLAREGYYNFLLVQNKASLDPGDSKEMVAARKRFLDGGHYAPIAEAVTETVRKISGEKGAAPLRILDAGCGEGYYLDYLAKAAEAQARPAELALAGIDISKWAVRAAAKRTKGVGWAVASNRQLPFAPGTIDLIFSVFGFPVWESFRAAQPAGGRLLLVDPGKEHLLELRQVIYPKVNLSEPPSLQAALEKGYRLEEEGRVAFTLRLEKKPEIQDLLAMTPHAYRMAEAGREKFEALERLEVTVDVVCRLLQRVDA